MIDVSKADLRRLKAEAQRLKALLHVGRPGLSAAFIQAVDEALRHHGLVKVKFDEFKEQKRELAAELAGKTASHLVTMVGHVAVFFRPKPTEEQ